MICINCAHKRTAVTNSRSSIKKPQTWRRRHCGACDTTFTSYEKPSLEGADIVTTKIGDVERFNLGILCISIYQAFSFNVAKGAEVSLALAETIEQQLALTPAAQITTDMIADLTHQALKRFDPAAAAQYAIQQELVISSRRAGRPSLVSRDQHPR